MKYLSFTFFFFKPLFKMFYLYVFSHWAWQLMDSKGMKFDAELAMDCYK